MYGGNIGKPEQPIINTSGKPERRPQLSGMAQRKPHCTHSVLTHTHTQTAEQQQYNEQYPVYY